MQKDLDAMRDLQANRLDHATIWGVAAAFGLVFLSIALGGGFSSFFNFKSFLIVVGGTLGATLINYPLADLAKAGSIIRTVIFHDYSPTSLRVRKLIEISQVARVDGPLALHSLAYTEVDPFLQKCLELTSDGMPAEEVKQILQTEMNFQEDRHRKGAEIFQSMGMVAPAMGLIGTLIGLVQMLEQLNDPASIGPAMAVALLTTFYGAILANLVFLPLAGKLRTRSEEERLLKELTIAGVVGIIAQSNPRIIEEQLLSYLPPEERISQFG